jgi:DMSO/TMAO reductase YedYZ molybdopterin-dependent catalytic subunit
MVVNERFRRRRQPDTRLPPGQYETRDFPVLTFGPTPRVERESWVLEARGSIESPAKWSWDEFNSLPHTAINASIHCVTRWTKHDTNWSGVSLDYLMSQVKPRPGATHLLAHSSDGYSTNIPISDLIGGRAMVATEYEGGDIPREHGGPARLLVPHLYFWKSAKWLKALEFIEGDKPGFWERRGYNNVGDPWKEQRFS